MRLTELDKKKSHRKTLYASRKVESPDAFIEWAKQAGFSSTLDPSDLHVTIAYSKSKVDWDKIGDPLDDTVEVKQPEERSIEEFDGGAIVLKIESDDLQERWRELCDLGCSWDYPDYHPHITITYGGAEGLDLDAIEPFGGTIELGPEVFREVDTKWKSNVKEKTVEGLDFEEAVALLIEGEKEKAVRLPGKFWFDPDTDVQLDCGDLKHGDYVAHHYRRMKLDQDAINDVLQGEDDETNAIEEGELCRVALGEGWVLGEGNELTAMEIDGLQEAVRHYADEWPDTPLVVIREDCWRTTLTPEEAQEFAQDGKLPMDIYEDVAPDPKRFWLVFDIPYRMDDARHEPILEGVSRGELQGVKGVSATREIITQFFYVARNSALVMNPQAVMQKNDLERIDYHNPAYLLADNMKALYRIWSKDPETKHGRKGLMQNLVQYTTGMLKQDYRLHHFFDYNGLANRISDYYAEGDGTGEKINTLSELQRFIRKATEWTCEHGGTWTSHLKQEIKTIDWSKIDEAIEKAVHYVGRLYSDEGEWLVKNPVFHVPKGSILMISVNKEALAKMPEYHRMKRDGFPLGFSGIDGIHKWHFEKIDGLMEVIDRFRLNERYTIRFIDEFKFAKVGPHVMVRRQERRRKID